MGTVVTPQELLELLASKNGLVQLNGAAPGKLAKEALSRQNEYSRFSALNPAERGGNSRAKTVGLQPAMVREQAV